MAAINFPTGASNGTTHYENGKLWTFDGVSWNITAQPANLTYLPNLSTVGIVTSGAWAATAITSKYGGFGSIPIVSKGDILVGSGNTWYNLPYSASNNQVLTVDTSQAFGIKWANAASSGITSPGGSDTYVQFNDGGSFGGTTDFTYIKSNSILKLSGISTVYPNLNIQKSDNGYFSNPRIGLKFNNSNNPSTATDIYNSSGIAFENKSGIGNTNYSKFNLASFGFTDGFSVFSITSEQGSSTGYTDDYLRTALEIYSYPRWTNPNKSNVTYIYGDIQLLSYYAGETLGLGENPNNGQLYVEGGVGIGKSLSVAGSFYIYNNNTTEYSGFKYSGNATTVYTLPTNTPQSASGTSVLASTIDGTMRWVGMGTGGAGTVNQGIQYSIPYYPSAGTLITGSSNFTNVGTGISITYTTASTSLTTGALVVSGGIGVGQTSNTKTLGINNVIEQMADTFTTSATGTGQTVHLVDSSVYRTLKYVIQTTSGSDYNSSEILLMHDGSTVYMTEYAQLLAGSGLTLATFDSDISGGKLRLLTSPTNASTSYKFICTALRV